MKQFINTFISIFVNLLIILSTVLIIGLPLIWAVFTANYYLTTFMLMSIPFGFSTYEAIKESRFYEWFDDNF